MSVHRIISYVILILFPIYEIFCYEVLRRSRDDISIRKRNMKMIWLSTVAAWLAYVNLINSMFGGIYCGIYHTFTVLISPLTIGPQLLRAITLWGMLRHNKLILEYGEKTSQMRRVKLLKHDGTSQGEQSGTCVIPLGTITEENSSNNFDNQNKSDISEGKQLRDNHAIETTKQVKSRMRKLVQFTRLMLVIITFVLLIVLFVTSEKSELTYVKFQECFPEPGIILEIVRSMTVVFGLLAFSTTILVRNCDDELGIRNEIQRNIIVIFTMNVVIFVVHYRGLYQWHGILLSLQQMLLSFSMIIMPCFHMNESLNDPSSLGKGIQIPGYGRSLPNAVNTTRSSVIRRVTQQPSREREMTMSLDAGFCILLSSDEGIKSFTEHCSREFSVENISFWSVINDFHTAVDSLRLPTSSSDSSEYDENDIRSFATEIYDSYIKVGGEFQINISGAERTKIQESIESNENVSRNVFDAAQKEMFSIMSRHSYPRYLASKHNDYCKNVKVQNRRGSVLPS